MNTLTRHVVAGRHPLWHNTSLWFYEREARDGVFVTRVAQAMEFKEIRQGDLQAEPTIELLPDHAQQLMDELWRVGFRPTEGSGSAGALAATQAHLKDMQRIVFKDYDEKKTDQLRPGAAR